MAGQKIEDHVPVVQYAQGIVSEYGATLGGELEAANYPAPPPSGTFVLTATNGVVTWESAD